jgi:hypothetical protein
MAKRKPKTASKSRRVAKEKSGATARGKYLGHYGWMPDVPDQRDLVFAAARITTHPPSVDLRSGCPPVYDQGQLGSCFPPGTLVRMADGSSKQIEHVRPLDEVVTAEGRIGRVESVMARDEEDSLVHVRLDGHNHLRVTSEHPLLTSRGYVRAGDLLLSDFVAMTR